MKLLAQFGSAALLCTSLMLSAGTAAASSESVVYSFPHNTQAFGRLLDVKAGTMYGTSYYGEANGDGAVYQLQQKRGDWNAKEIVQFGGADGRHPYAGVVQDSETGTLFGTTTDGGLYSRGTIFSARRVNG